MTKDTKKVNRVDWDAVERDYGTAKFTLRELAAKYGCTHQAIGNQIKRKGWTQDLSIAIKKATNAKLVNDLVAEEIAKGGLAVANTVLAAAELNASIILRHRTRLVDLAKDIDMAKAKLMAISDSVADIREAGVLLSAIGNLAGVTKTLIDQERKVFGIGEENEADKKPDLSPVFNITLSE